MDLYSILNVLQNLEEGTMTSAEQNPTGPDNFTGYWKGTDKRTPGKHMVGASEDVEQECERAQPSLADKLKARWEQTKREKGLQEYGMTTGGTMGGGGTSSTDNKPDPAEISKTQQSLNKLKTAGVNIPNVAQAVKSTLRDPNTPATTQDKNIAAGLGQEVEQLVAKGDPNMMNQLTSIIQKNKKQDGAQ
jgi:hypothetical protein